MRESEGVKEGRGKVSREILSAFIVPRVFICDVYIYCGRVARELKSADR